MRGASRALAASVRDGYLIRASVLVERLPLVAPPLEPWEAEYAHLRREQAVFDAGTMPAFIRDDYADFLRTQKHDMYYEGDLVTSEEGDLRSRNRVLDQTLFLLTKAAKGKHPWHFPTGTLREGESLTGIVQRRLLQECGSSLDVFLTGNSPIAHHVLELPEEKQDGYRGVKTFFLRGYVTSGNADIAKSNNVDFQWATKAALPALLSKSVFSSVEGVLDH